MQVHVMPKLPKRLTFFPPNLSNPLTASAPHVFLQGVLRAFKGQLIHTFNKREGALLHAAHFRELQERPNVLLLGDSLGDLTMADGVAHTQHALTIGFLNDQVGAVFVFVLPFCKPGSGEDLKGSLFCIGTLKGHTVDFR